MRQLTALAAIGFALAVPPSAMGEAPSYSIAIHDHGFAPASLTVPAGARIRLRVTNKRSLPSEFESGEMNCEKVVPGGTTVSVWIGPLKPGKYKFFDDFNTGVNGWIIATAGKAGARK